MHYRLYQPDDFAQLYAIEERCFQPPLRFSRDYMRQLVVGFRTAAWVAEEKGILTGFAIVELFQDQQTIAYLETIEVAAEHRRQGIGAELLRRIEDSSRRAGAKWIWLHVDTENESAIRMYEAHGYWPQGVKENYYASSRDALVYAKPIDKD